MDHVKKWYKRKITRMRIKYISITMICIVSIFAYHIYYTTKKNNEYINSLQAYNYLSNYHVWSGIFNTTLYTFHPADCGKDKESKHFGITYSGYRATPFRTVAVDPKVVPLGSILVEMQTGNKYIAEDTGNKVKGYHVDICIGEGTKSNRKVTDKFGTRQLMFFIIEQKCEKKILKL